MKTSILFVDDDPGVTGALKRLFHKSGFAVSIANSGAQALAMMNHQQYTVIVSDQLMPGMNGTHFLLRAHIKQPEALKIMFSGDIDTMTDNDALHDNDICQFIPKPCFDDELISYINSALQAR